MYHEDAIILSYYYIIIIIFFSASTDTYDECLSAGISDCHQPGHSVLLTLVLVLETCDTMLLSVRHNCTATTTPLISLVQSCSIK